MAESAETPKDLFAKCEADAQVGDRKGYERLLSLIAGALTFPEHLYKPAPLPDSQGKRYRDLVRLLKQYRGQTQRWILLAVWLKQEKICDPIDFLPEEVYKKLTREKGSKLRISIADYQYHSRVEAWKPYFDRLLRDRRAQISTSRDIDQYLESLGYDPDAIAAARKKRAAIPAVCEWLAARLGVVDAPTIRNAHSRVSSKPRHKKA